MIPERKRWLMHDVKALTTLAVFFFVSWQFKEDLEELRPRKNPAGIRDRLAVRSGLATIPISLPWLAASAALYLLEFFRPPGFWQEHLQFSSATRFRVCRLRGAHYISQLGKYVPGKAAIAILPPSIIVRRSYGVSIIASFYEVFTGMASGAHRRRPRLMVELPGEVRS